MKGRRVCVVGKGPSLGEFRNVGYDLAISCNEAIYEVQHGIVTRIDAPGFDFCKDLPLGAVPIVPRHLRDQYAHGYYFGWHTLGMTSRIPSTGCVAIYLAAFLGAEEIILCGFDALLTGDRRYVETVANEANRERGLRDQRKNFLSIDALIRAKCRHYDGTPLNQMAEVNAMPPASCAQEPPARKSEPIKAIKIVDGIPQVTIRKDYQPLLHLSKFPRDKAPRKACIVGKGPSLTKWREVPDVDAYFTVNEATYMVDRQHFHVRGDGNRKEHRFCDWLQSFAVPMVPERLKEYYGYGYWFTWDDIGSDGICLTSIMAVRLAYWMGAREIVLCGFDALRTGDVSYDAQVVNSRNRSLPYNDQKSRFRDLPEALKSCCRHFDGSELVNPCL